MKIAVVGVGAMGSVYAALLADAGNDVSVIDTSLDQVSAIRRGLRVEGAVETESYDCTQRTTPARSAP